MSSVSNRRALARLEQELNSHLFESLFRALQLREPFLFQFETWSEVITFMRTGTSDDPRKDKVLRPLFQFYRQRQDPRCYHVLIVIFWPALVSIHFKKRFWDEDSESLWSNVIWAFTRAVERLNTARRPDRIVQKIYCDVVHDLYLDCKKSWRRALREVLSDPDEIEALAGTIEGIDLDTIALKQECELEVRRLRQHVSGGRISESDFLLLLGTRLYGQPLAEYARENNLNYEMAKKRRQRAEKAIRGFEG